ncbi:sulfhydryl oxidase 1-like isoform X2 [Phoenix dactylifera]|uniref:Sulfhydryl oxidase n=1 Tax=Phoenix dactylifera TaxID=42345 RepID=A0A8B7BXR4_PHODC|nr:sulfhydryl oxidase 1-like isoform X2 [Phoenix dactylifera]
MSISNAPSHLVLLLFVLLISVFEAFAGPSRSLLRTLGDGPDLPDAAVDLNSSNFDRVLKESPAAFAVVEFFAHWCPACRNYKSHYEKVARLFNGPDAPHPGIVIMTRVDCAMKMNTNLCDRFSVGHFPMLLWGPPPKFASSRWDPKQEKSEIQSIDDGRTADRLLKWINKQIGSSFNLDDEKYENENTLPRNDSDPEQIARAIYDVEEATAGAFDIILEHKMIKSDTRVPLIKFFQLLVTHHPSKRCRRGSAEILVNFDDLWPSDLFSVGSQETNVLQERGRLKGYLICGKEVPRGYWIFCRGSKNDTRGFSCGLWVLLHSLSVRVADGESHLAFTAICDFIHNFFICEECRRHFYDMCSSASVPFNTTRDLSLWLWSTHNKVNERLRKEEKALRTGDPRFPKVIWPPEQLCPSCYLSSISKRNGTAQVDWNEDEVFNFLVQYYGKTLVSSYKDASLGRNKSDESVADDIITSTNAVAVPLGAAMAIAFASCAFGALACFWRTQQKNRKQRKKNRG